MLKRPSVSLLIACWLVVDLAAEVGRLAVCTAYASGAPPHICMSPIGHVGQVMEKGRYVFDAMSGRPRLEEAAPPRRPVFEPVPPQSQPATILPPT